MRSNHPVVRPSRKVTGAALVSVLVWLAVTGTCADPPSGGSKTGEKTDDVKRVSLEVARDRARLTHNIYAAALDVMHERYFRIERSVVPARAMQDVFSEIAKQENIKANWIAVNSRAMSIDHNPKTDFEKQAAKELSRDKQIYERVDNGVYRRAERISLMNRGCLGCHLAFGDTTTKKRFAGLVISIPVDQSATLGRK